MLLKVWQVVNNDKILFESSDYDEVIDMIDFIELDEDYDIKSYFIELDPAEWLKDNPNLPF